MVKKLGRSPNDCERDGFVEEGVEERLNTLERRWPDASLFFEQALDETRGRGVKPDDIVDAMAMFVTD